MKLARIADNEPFYSVVIERTEAEGGAELFDFGVVVPNTLRPDMPLSHLEYLPVLMQMQERDGVLSRIQARLQNAPADEYAAFRRSLRGETLLPPVEPPSFRDFYAFEQHVRNAPAEIAAWTWFPNGTTRPRSTFPIPRASSARTLPFASRRKAANWITNWRSPSSSAKRA